MMIFPQLLTVQNALATGVLFLLAGIGWGLGTRIAGISLPARKQ